MLKLLFYPFFSRFGMNPTPYPMKKYIFLFLFGIIGTSMGMMAQDTEEVPTDDLGNVSDAFQENFFEALKQKGIENYELALNALQKAERAAKKDPVQEAVVYFEKGKNLKFLKRYDEAEENFQKVRSLKLM